MRRPGLPEPEAHPTAAERFFFDNNGYLVLENFLSADHVHALLTALQRAIERRTGAGYQRAHPTAFPEQLDGPNSRVFPLLDEAPLFLDLMAPPPMLEYVHGLLNPMPH